MLFPWFLCCILGCIVVFVCIKLFLLKKGMQEICVELKEHLEEETNTMITISTRDFYVRQIARKLNIQLRLLRKQRQEYESGNRELKELVANISHDLRTPLTAICGYLELLEDIESTPEAKHYIDIITNRVELMKQLSEELFCFSIINSSQKKEAKKSSALNEVLEESIAGFYPLLKERGIEPVVQIPDTKIMRFLEVSALSRIFANLLQNAIKYSDGDLFITLTEEGELTFVNTASSLNEVQVARLFDRFYTVHRAEASTGLGLEITRKLLYQMNGTIMAEYREKKLRIKITFPSTDG